MKKTTQYLFRTNSTVTTLLTIGTLVLIFTTGAGKPPNGASDIPLRVTIESFGMVAGDGNGEYRNGEKGVAAVFTGGQGRFYFDTGNRRGLNVIIPGLLEPGNYRVSFFISRGVQDPNVNTNPDPNWHDLDLDQIAIGASVPVGLLFTITASSSDTGSWRVAFGDYPLATEQNFFPCAAAAPAWVTRVDAITWRFQSDDNETHCLTHGLIDDRDFPKIAFPFAITLRSL
jgi:hypothetical protein